MVDDLSMRIVGDVKAESGDCVVKPMNVKEYKTSAADDTEREKAIEENTIDEVDADAVGQD